jgi:hypothetical protein
LSVLVVPPVTPQEQTVSHLWPGRTTYTCPTGEVHVVLDTDAFEFHVTAPLDHPVEILAAITLKLASMGLEPLNDLDGEEFLDDGRLRIYLQPIEPVSDTAIPLITVRACGRDHEVSS